MHLRVVETKLFDSNQTEIFLRAHLPCNMTSEITLLIKTKKESSVDTEDLWIHRDGDEMIDAGERSEFARQICYVNQ